MGFRELHLPPCRQPVLRSADAAGRCASSSPGLCTPTHSLICQHALLQSWPREQLHESPCSQPSSGPRRNSPGPAAKPTPGASPQQGNQEMFPAPLFTAHSRGHKASLQFRSGFKDARRDVTTKRACSSTVPTRTHDTHSSPTINASLPVHPQRSCAADLRVHRCHDHCVYLTGKDTHTERSGAASDAAAEPETQLEPVPASCSAPLASPESLLHPRRSTGGESTPRARLSLQPWRRGRHPAACSCITGVPLSARHASAWCWTGGKMLAGTTGKAWLSW